MKTLKLTSLFFLSSFLMACGSGSGDGSGTARTPDGDKINLTLSPKGTVEKKTTNGILFGQNNSASFYGIWRNDAKTMEGLRYQGTEATNIPTSGTAVYRGDAVWSSGNEKGFAKGGDTTLNVDFGTKVVNGYIDFSGLKGEESRSNITLHESNLTGAKFEGLASVVGNSGGQYGGALFGNGAKEAAGLVKFENNSSLDVSFGDTRDQ